MINIQKLLNQVKKQQHVYDVVFLYRDDGSGKVSFRQTVHPDWIYLTASLKGKKLEWNTEEELQQLYDEVIGKEEPIYDLPSIELNDLGDCSLEVFSDNSYKINYPDGSSEAVTLTELIDILPLLKFFSEEVDPEVQNELKRLRNKITI